MKPKIAEKNKPIATMIPMDRSQSLQYRHAARHDPVTARPASGTIINIIATKNAALG